jgi:hypothetical protein
MVRNTPFFFIYLFLSISFCSSLHYLQIQKMKKKGRRPSILAHLFSGRSQRYSLKEDSCLSSSHGERALREPSTKRLSLTCSSLPPTSTPHQTLALFPPLAPPPPKLPPVFLSSTKNFRESSENSEIHQDITASSSPWRRRSGHSDATPASPNPP